MVDVPHLALPLTLTAAGRLATVEQDGLEDVASCVRVLLATPRGSRLEVPEFGVPDLAFTTDLDVAELLAAVEDWEPRAHIDAEAVTGQGPDGLQASVLAAVTLAEDT